LHLVKAQVNPDGNLLYPLSEFYEQSGLPLPAVSRVEGQDIPEPCQSLLVHERDLTPTLESAYQRNMLLRVLHHTLSDSVLSRQVVLVPRGAATPAAFGAIKIYLENFPSRARALILEFRQPLGTILRTQQIGHASRPGAHIRIKPDDLVTNALRLADPGVLYGRRNVLLDAAHRVLARVVEILPPAKP
jgi:chorismate-pyruvate lyase